jgi:hypothetical protein
VDIEDRSVIQRDPDSRQFCRQRPCKLSGQRRIVTPAEHRHRRPLGERRPEPRHAPAFLIDSDPGRQLDAESSQVERQLGHLPRRLDVAQPSKERDPAEIELAGEGTKFDWYIGSVKAAYQELADPAAKRLRRHDLSL